MGRRGSSNGQCGAPSSFPPPRASSTILGPQKKAIQGNASNNREHPILERDAPDRLGPLHHSASRARIIAGLCRHYRLGPVVWTAQPGEWIAAFGTEPNYVAPNRLASASSVVNATSVTAEPNYVAPNRLASASSVVNATSVTGTSSILFAPITTISGKNFPLKWPVTL
jgi:hypothetical protein